MANRPFDTSLWARPGIPMPDATAQRPLRWYHLAIFAGLFFYVGFLAGRVG